MKDFKTIDEQIQLLNSRGVITDDFTASALERESYYAIINGYKGPFLDRQAMTKTHEDVYLPGTEFDWIYTLFLFDRELRALTFRFLSQAEAIMRTSVVYSFCEVNQGVEDYMNRRLYAPSKDLRIPKGFKGTKAEYRQKNLNKLINIFKKKKRPNTDKAFIKHYIDHHGYVPLWVLANDLTFGNINMFYQLQRRSIQNAGCKLIIKASMKEKEYAPNILTPETLSTAFSILVDFRNICAHDNRLYCARVGKGRNADYRDMLYYLMIILPEAIFVSMLEEIHELFKVFGDALQIVTPQSLMRDMGIELKRNSKK